MAVGKSADSMHEGIGQGDMCIATVGRQQILSTMHFEWECGSASCSSGRDARQSDLWSAVLGAARAAKQSALSRFFLWLLMTLSRHELG